MPFLKRHLGSVTKGLKRSRGTYGNREVRGGACALLLSVEGTGWTLKWPSRTGSWESRLGLWTGAGLGDREGTS